MLNKGRMPVRGAPIAARLPIREADYALHPEGAAADRSGTRALRGDARVRASGEAQPRGPRKRLQQAGDHGAEGAATLSSAMSAIPARASNRSNMSTRTSFPWTRVSRRGHEERARLRGCASRGHEAPSSGHEFLDVDTEALRADTDLVPVDAKVLPVDTKLLGVDAGFPARTRTRSVWT